MKSGTRVALAVGFGYLLGRRRKLRTALTLAAAVAAGRASQNPGGLLKYGTDLLNSSTQLGNLSKLGAPLATAGKAAATAAAGSGIDALSGKLRGSADALRRKSGGGQPEEDAAVEERSAPDEEQELAEQPEAGDDYDRDERPVVARRQRGR
ncbi:hypothetical protein EV384_0300 [Micromonospora kangleipakensis]|uniref:Uncharacterized protein n=1 Tax=Micromonospora kangleipakensis TaxID=1077942 RepID=A0A4V2GCH6_9ACTN|nr:hypothetical protein [Micromonospora kangleipakensis]RZU71966.1 hypothetical protein EV384_0300 [Micromonospora kangleipakensis]